MTTSVPEQLWQAIQPLLPTTRYGGRPRIDDRVESSDRLGRYRFVVKRSLSRLVATGACRSTASSR
jgi:hypothetical protein